MNELGWAVKGLSMAMSLSDLSPPPGCLVLFLFRKWPACDTQATSSVLPVKKISLWYFSRQPGRKNEKFSSREVGWILEIFWGWANTSTRRTYFAYFCMCVGRCYISELYVQQLSRKVLRARENCGSARGVNMKLLVQWEWTICWLLDKADGHNSFCYSSQRGSHDNVPGHSSLPA